MKIFCPSAAGSRIACWCALLVATAFGWTSPAGAALSAVPERTFATNGPVTAVLPLGDKIFLGGSFSELGLRTGPGVALSRGTGEPVGNVAEVTEASDGRVPEVDAVIADGSGGWYIGGTFERVGGASVKTLAHVRADGAVDPHFTPRPGTSSEILTRPSPPWRLPGGRSTSAATSAPSVASSARRWRPWMG